MRLDKPIDSTGEFWLPGSPDDKVSGTLRIAQNGEVTLELAGAFSGLAASVRHRRPGRHQFGEAYGRAPNPFVGRHTETAAV